MNIFSRKSMLYHCHTCSASVMWLFVHLNPVIPKVDDIARTICKLLQVVMITECLGNASLALCEWNPVGTRHNNNVFITSKRRRRRRFDVMKTISLRRFCVMCPLGIHRLALTKEGPIMRSFILPLMLAGASCCTNSRVADDCRLLNIHGRHLTYSEFAAF